MRGLPEQRVTWHLDNWAEWIRDQRSDFGFGFRTNDNIFASGNSREFDTMVAEADMRCAKAVDTSIADLPAPESNAVCHFHLAAVFRVGQFRAKPVDMNDAYRRAREYLALALARKGIE